MPKFSANLSMLFTEVPFMSRFARAAEAGFEAVEFMFPYEVPAEELSEQLGRHHLIQVLHNLPAGDWAGGERGIACIPGREQEFQDGVGVAIEYATALGCTRLNCLAGLRPPDWDGKTAHHTLIANLRFAADALAREGLTLLVEPLNDKDIVGFYLTGSEQTLDLLDELDRPGVMLQYDIYHMQRMEGDLIGTITGNIDRIGHIQLADNPGRHEPGTGEINFANLFTAIDQAGYKGWLGCEYRPAAGTETGLGWINQYR